MTKSNLVFRVIENVANGQQVSNAMYISIANNSRLSGMGNISNGQQFTDALCALIADGSQLSGANVLDICRGSLIASHGDVQAAHIAALKSLHKINYFRASFAAIKAAQ